MKKIIAILLSVLCLFSVFAVSASANVIDDVTGLMTDIGGDDPVLYCVVYKKEFMSDVKTTYFPNPTPTFDGAGYIKVTNDTPIAINHTFVCWKDKDGNLYNPGDEFFVDGECELYPVWEEKKDKDSYIIRVIKTGIETLVRIFQKLLGIFEVIDEDYKAYYSTLTDPTVDENEYDEEDRLDTTQTTAPSTTLAA